MDSVLDLWIKFIAVRIDLSLCSCTTLCNVYCKLFQCSLRTLGSGLTGFAFPFCECKVTANFLHRQIFLPFLVLKNVGSLCDSKLDFYFFHPISPQTGISPIRPDTSVWLNLAGYFSYEKHISALIFILLYKQLTFWQSDGQGNCEIHVSTFLASDLLL